MLPYSGYEGRRVWTALERFAYKSAIFLVPFVSSCSARGSHCRGGLRNLPTRPFPPLSGKKKPWYAERQWMVSASLKSLRRT